MTAHDWTLQQQLDALMRLPWSIRVERDDTDASLVAQVDEVPDAIATGNTLRELARDLWESLAASLEIRLQHGDTIPHPKGIPLPWEADARLPFEPVEITVAQRLGDVIVRPRATAAA